MPDRKVRVSLARRLPGAGSEFVSVEALGGILLLIATLTAVVWANVSGSSYDDLWHRVVTIGVDEVSLSLDLHHWINDGLMAVFFFVVGLEIKRELVRGDLRDPRTASLPIIAAFGGMIVPAMLFVVVNAGGDGSRGWGIPMATDIAFAVAVLALLGSRVPSPLKLFLLTLAIVDDVGAIIVIALFYSDHIGPTWLIAGIACVSVVVVLQRLRIAHPFAYLIPALALWVCLHESGVHATIAGVALGLLTPAHPFGGRHVIERLEHQLHPWSSFVIIPLFALANAGVQLDTAGLRDASGSAITWGIVIGLVVGKPAGIIAATALALRLRLGQLPAGIRIGQIAGVGAIAGIGFTVSLFIAGLSFEDPVLAQAKVGILAASLLSAGAGCAWLLGADKGDRQAAPPT